MGIVSDIVENIKKVVLLTERMTDVSNGVNNLAVSYEAQREHISKLESMIERQRWEIGQLQKDLKESDDERKGMNTKIEYLSMKIHELETTWKTVALIRGSRKWPDGQDLLPPAQDPSIDS